ncbi:camp-binding protein [hydrocarbon metagenome]|uniref:Camp-binding protein n=1 Tax=hydrocarbon metagenome TaxID=938273 RepID=A0A0W8FXY2_9ZZZZ
MKFPKSINITPPLFVFLILLFLVLTEVFYFEKVNSKTTLDRIFFLIIHISFWLSAAYLFNSIINKFFWGGINKIPTGSFLLNKIKDFLGVLTYAIVLVIIFVNYFDVESKFGLLAVALIATLIGTFIRPYFMCFLRSVFLSNSVAFNIGDWIKLSAINSDKEIIGEVDNIDRRNLQLKTESDTIVTISQSSLTDFVVENFWGSGKETRLEINFNFDKYMPVKRIKRVLLAAAEQSLDDYNLISSNETEVIIKQITDDTIHYTIYFWINPWAQISPEKIIDKIISTSVEYLQISGLYFADEKGGDYLISTSTEIKRIISSIDLFDTLNENELIELANGINETEFLKEEKVIKENDEGNSMFVVVEGLLDVFVNSKDGKQIKVGRLTPGDFFGEMSLMTGDKRSATVICLTDVLLYEIRKESISKIIGNREEVINEFGEIISRRTRLNVEFKEKYEKSKQSFLNEIVGKIKNFFKHG